MSAAFWLFGLLALGAVYQVAVNWAHRRQMRRDAEADL